MAYSVSEVQRSSNTQILEVLDRAGSLNGRRPGIEPGEIVDAEVVEVHSVPTENHDDE